MNKQQRRSIIAGLVGLALVVTACGSDQGATEETDTSTAQADQTTMPGAEIPALVGGEVFVTGSSTVEPIAVLVGEFADEMSGGDLAVTVEGPGTGDGFKKFCAGEADVSNASREIKDEEAASCAEAGIEFIELAVAIDGLTVATSPNNTAVTCLDTAALYALIGPESEGFGSWADANALLTELGSTSGPLPDAPLTITGPGPESGTYDSFVEFAIKSIAGDRGTEDTTRTDYTQSANDNLIVEGIEGSDTSLGWVGYAFYEAEQDRMKALEVDKGDGCVAPTAETIADGSYPFSRTLYMYVSVAALADNPAVGSYIDLVLSEQGLAKVSEAGYVALGADALAATQQAWTDAKA